MQQLTPKQREIRTRETRILALARPMVAEGGISALSMDAIAKEMQYAKGTIYNHFGCKEEILLALAIQASETRLALFRAGSDSESQSRDRMAAVGIACEEFRTRFGDLFAIEHLVRHATIWEKASDRRRETLATCESRCMGLVSSIGHDAVAAGDLPLPRGHQVEDLVFGLWSLTYGGMVIDESSPGLKDIGIRDTFAAIRRNCNAMMDGFQWKPLFDPDAYGKVVKRVRRALARQIPDGFIALPDSKDQLASTAS